MHPTTKITALIQARMSSTRLPGKVLLEVEGKPFLWHIIHRLKFCKNIDKIIIATSTNLLDNAIEDFARNENIPCYRGSEEDLLDRIYNTCLTNKVETFIRVTADCPFVDSKLVDQLVEFYEEKKNGYNLISNVHPPTYPDGLDLEIIPFKVIEETHLHLTNKFDREWFTSYLFEKSKYKNINYHNDIDISKMRWTLDTPEDYEFFKIVFHNLFDINKAFSKEDILEFLEKNPEVAKINDQHSRNYAYHQELEKQTETKEKKNLNTINKGEINTDNIEQNIINKKITTKKIIVVGCGSIGLKHIRNLTTFFNGKIICCDANKDILNDIKKEFPLLEYYFDLDEALRIEEPEYAIIATPNHLHLPIANKTINYCKNILIEKPISHNLEGIEPLLQQAKEKKVKIIVGFNMRFNKTIRKIKEMVLSNRLGHIYSIKINFGSYLPNRHPGKDYTNDYVSKEKFGGGVILDVIHEIDYLVWIFGEPEEIFSFADKRSDLLIETEDSADILIKFKNKSVGNIHLDMLRQPYTRTCEIVGQNGTIIADIAKNELKTFNTTTKEWEIITFDEQSHNETYIEELKRFISLSEEEDNISSTGESATTVLKIVLGAKESAKTGKIIKIINTNKE